MLWKERSNHQNTSLCSLKTSHPNLTIFSLFRVTNLRKHAYQICTWYGLLSIAGTFNNMNKIEKYFCWLAWWKETDKMIYFLNQPSKTGWKNNIFTNINVQLARGINYSQLLTLCMGVSVSLAPQNSKHLRLLYKDAVLNWPELFTEQSSLEDMACFWAVNFEIDPSKLQFLHLKRLKTMFEKLISC